MAKARRPAPNALQEWWLDSKHPIYDLNVDLWEKNERRLRGGEEVLDELHPFDWETLSDDGPNAVIDPEIASFEILRPGEHLQVRKDMATYLNFPDICATALVGTLMQKAPKPGGDISFGTLGDVQRKTKGAKPSRAEMVYYNADGVGTQSSEWDNFWAGVGKWAMATGHRWLMVEAPFIAPLNQQDEINGRRPYLVQYSPISVPNWHFNREGQLEFAIIRFPYRNPDYTGTMTKASSGQFGPDIERYGYYVLTRTGFQGFGPEYSVGGWWQFDDLRQRMPEGHGTWDKTDGEIPMWPHFYQREVGTIDKPAMSRPGLTELGNCAVAFMNISSCADFNATEAAGSVKFISGVDESGYNLAMGLIKRGSRYAPLPNEVESGKPPGVSDGTGGQIASTVFETRLKAKREEAREIAALESTSTAESSGLSLQGKQQSERNPRLALMAAEIETSQNKALHFLELRFGETSPTAATHWTRDFNLIELVDRIEDFFKLESLTGYRSPTLGARAMMLAAKDRRIITDEDDAQTIQDEYTEAAQKIADAPAVIGTASGGRATLDAGPGGPGGPAGPKKTKVVKNPNPGRAKPKPGEAVPQLTKGKRSTQTRTQ